MTATLGPGHHGGELLAALRAQHIEYRAISAWPDFAVEDWPGGARVVRPWYRWFRRAMWGAWRRLPQLGQKETPRIVDLRVYEELAARQLAPCDLFIGWTQVSLRGLQKAREQGIPTVLEHPMTHVSEWMRVMAEEYRRWGGRRRAFYSQFPAPLVARMNAEVEIADYITVLSSFARRTFLDAGVAPERVIELPLGVDAEVFSPGPRAGGRFCVLCVGRLELLKGVQYLLEAVSGLDVTTRLVGTIYGETEALLRRPQVEVLPPVPRAELPGLYRSADVVVFPSVNDALGLVILEAMACGVPVVASDRSGGPDLISDGIDGFVVPARDPAAIRERLQRLRDPELRRRMGEAARSKVLSRYTPGHYAERVGALIRRVANPAGRQ